MNSNITPTFVFLAVALGVWAFGFSLSDYLSGSFAREHGSESSAGIEPGATPGGGTPSSAQRLARAQKLSAENPKDLGHKTELGFALMQVAMESGQSASYMEAVKIFSEVVREEPNHADALLGMANVSLQAGVLDKALDFYQRYFKVRPEDYRAKLDYAFALINSQRAGEARDLLQSVMAENKVAPQHQPDLHLVLSLAYKALGEKDRALEQLKQAIAAEVDPQRKEQLESLITEINSNQSVGEIAANQQVATVGGNASSAEQALQSPAARVEQFFAAHPIIGAKLKGVNWKGSAVAQVLVVDFPVEQMPPFAKEQFIGKVKQNFADLKNQLTIALVDAVTQRELLSIAVGSAVSDRAVSDRAVSDRAVSDHAVSDQAVLEQKR